MKKQIIVILGATVLLSACGLFSNEEQKTPPTGTGTVTSSTTETTPPAKEKTPASYVQVVSESVKAGNVETCKNLTDPVQQKQCNDQVLTTMAISKSDKTICGQLNENDQQNCEEVIDVKGYELAGEVDKCSTISNENLKKDCYNNAYFNKAVAEKNKALCEKITFEPQKATCLKAVQ